MEANKIMEFPTKREAEAFAEGVDFVNDSSIEILRIEKGCEGWLVEMHDLDERRDGVMEAG